MKRRTKSIIGIVVIIVAAGLTVGFTSRRGKDVTPVTMAMVERTSALSPAGSHWP